VGQVGGRREAAKVEESGLERGRRAGVRERVQACMKREGGSWKEVERVGGWGKVGRNRWAGVGGMGNRGRRTRLGKGG
jgi:hypothetical protein